MNYKILMITNKNNPEFVEDLLLKERFEKDGNIVDVKWIDYDGDFSEYDIIIRRDSWIEEEKDMPNYKYLNNKLINKLKKNNNTVNLVGLDGIGKTYLKDLYYKGYEVIPTTDILKDALNWNVPEYLLKLKDSFGSGLGQFFVSKDELVEKYRNEYLIQPKIKFKSELQAYFINDELMYAFEYTPSKWPNNPTPHMVELTDKYKELAIKFAAISPLRIGMKRIDFLRLEDDSIILLEIEDNSPYMNIDMLDDELKNKVLDKYVIGIYNYIKEIKLTGDYFKNDEYWKEHINKELEIDMWIDDYSKYFKPGLYLDLGCGIGQYSKKFIEDGNEVISADISNIALEKVKEFNKNIVNLDMQKRLPFEDNKFDVVFANLSIHYFNDNDTKSLLSEIKRILKTNGVFIGSVNGLEGLDKIKDTAKVLEEHFYYNKNKYIRLFDKKDLEKYLSVFEILKIEKRETKRFESKKNYWIFIVRKGE